MEDSKTILITFGMKHLKNNIMTKTQEIVKFILTAGIVVFGLIVLSFGFRVILTGFLN
jgi:hypothetical protein